MSVVILVDDDNNDIGVEDKAVAHRRGLLHRALSVFIFDASNRLLMQQRALDKYHSGGLWSNTCCSHPLPGESIAAAASRRLHEEMGMSADLTYVGHITYRLPVGELVEHELDHLFVGVCRDAPTPDPAEVAAWRWWDADSLHADIARSPAAFTPWLPLALARVLRYRAGRAHS